MSKESGLYYLQSRYYDPEIGRFINADAFASTGQGILGNNMFAYCGNNPVIFADYSGTRRFPCNICINDGGTVSVEDANEAEPEQELQEEFTILNTNGISLYKGVPVVKLPFGGNVGFSAGVIFLGDSVNADAQGVATLKHEYGHAVHLSQIGWESYTALVLIPSIVNFHRGVAYADYYSQPWEYIADMLGGVERTNGNSPYAYSASAQEQGDKYYQLTLEYAKVFPN